MALTSASNQVERKYNVKGYIKNTIKDLARDLKLKTNSENLISSCHLSKPLYFLP